MPGPRKPDYSGTILQVTQSNFAFLLDTLWSSAGQALRDKLIDTRDEAELKRELARYKIEIEPGSKLMIVDVVGARVNSFVTDAATQEFYVLVLPPKPRRHPGDKRYEELQGWMTAHYHAVNDSYGM